MTMCVCSHGILMLAVEALEEQQDQHHQQLGEAHQGIRFAIVCESGSVGVAVM